MQQSPSSAEALTSQNTLEYQCLNYSCNDSKRGLKQSDSSQASLLSGKIFSPSSTSAPSNMVHSGMHTNVSLTSASFSSLAHSVRQKPSLSSMAVRYQARRRRSGEPLRASYPGLQRPAILMASMRMRMLSKIQTGRKMRNQFHCTLRVEIKRMMTTSFSMMT